MTSLNGPLTRSVAGSLVGLLTRAIGPHSSWRRWYHRTLIAALVLAGAALIDAGGAAAGAYPLRLTDGLGRVVTLPAPPARIVSLAPSTTEMLFAVGAGQQVVGVTRWCDYPTEAARLPKVGDMNIDVERVVALRPDLVVGDGGLEPRVITQLDKLGIRVLAVAPSSLDGVMKSLALLGKATGHAKDGDELVAALSERVAKLTAAGRKTATGGSKSAGAGGKTAAAGNKPVRVFVLLDGSQLYTAGPGTFIDELVRLAGGANIAGDAKAAWPLFSEEALLTRDPEVIIATYVEKSEIMGRSRWQGLSAVKSGRVFSVDPDIISRPGPRLVDGLALMVDILAKSR